METADREIVLTRTFNAPRELVFDAWTDPKHVSEWWGPNGFTTTIHEMDVRPGGIWRFTMHGPDGTDYGNRVVFLSVQRPESLAYRHESENSVPDVQFQVRVRFEEWNGRTELTMRMVFASAEMRDLVVRKYGAEEGAHQTVARLQAYVERLAQGGSR